MIPIWLAIAFGCISCIGTVYAVAVSHSARDTAETDKATADKITLALSQFRADIMREITAMFAHRELFEERFKTIDAKFAFADRDRESLNSRVSRLET